MLLKGEGFLKKKRLLSYLLSIFLLLNLLPNIKVSAEDTMSEAPQGSSTTVNKVKEGAEDVLYPWIESVSVNMKEARPGDTVKITVRVADDVSGVDYFDARVVEYNSYFSEESTKELRMNWQRVSEEVYEGTYTVGQYDLGGLYKIQLISLGDRASHYRGYLNQDLYEPFYGNRVDYSEADFTITGTTYDITAPTITSVSVDKKNPGVGETVTVTINVSDDVAGVDSFRSAIVGPGNYYPYVQFTKVSEGVYQGKYVIEQYNNNGTPM